MATAFTGPCVLAPGVSALVCKTTCRSRLCRGQAFTSQQQLCRRRSTTVQRHIVHCSAEDFEEGELMKGVKAGDKLKVKESRTVWHSPKHKEGLDLKGMEGTIVDVIEKYQGKQLSANLPYKTQFLIPNEDTGKEQKLICHLAAGEFDKL